MKPARATDLRTGALAALAVCLVFPRIAWAREVAGVSMPEAVTVEGKTLQLNGMGLRTRAIFRVYVAGLYLENRSKNAATVVRADQIKRVQMSFLRDLDGSQIAEAIRAGFERNSKAQMGALQNRLEKLRTLLPDVEKGGQLTLTYVPGKGVLVSAKGVEKGVIQGKDFADALFSVWLGPHPVDEALKKALLGG